MTGGHVFTPGRRHFSHAEATALLGMVRDAFDRALPLRRRVMLLAGELARLGFPMDLRDLRVDGNAPPDVRKKQAELMATVNDLERTVGELGEHGIEVKSGDGLVDFRSRHEGRVVHLCWRYGEESIAFWHELDAGFSHRQPVEDPRAFAGDPRN